MMTLDETIKHCEEVAEKNENKAQVWHKQTKNKIVDFCDKAIQAENDCIECARDHKQLAEWLIELKQLREQEPILDKIRAEIDRARFIDKDTRHCRNALASGLEVALQIIDKYKTESEVEK